jgi:hypothetical protein
MRLAAQCGTMKLDRKQLIKLLNLTGSDYDAEALGAIRRSNALLRRHQMTWAELLAPSHDPLQTPQPRSPQARPQRHKSSPMGSHGSRGKPMWEYHTRYTQQHRHWTAYESRQEWLSRSLGVFFFPVTVFTWLYKSVVRTRRRWLKPVAMLVPVFGAGIAAMIWLVMLLSVAQLIGIV